MVRNVMALPVLMALVLSPVVLAQEPSPGYLGVFGESTAPDADHQGALVTEVVSDGPADKAGVKVGDVVIAVGDQTIDGFDSLAQAMKSHQPGEKLAVKVWRDGKEKTLSVVLGDRPSTPVIPSFPFDAGPRGNRFRFPDRLRDGQFEVPEQWRQYFEGTSRPMIGVQLQEIDDTLRDRLKLGDVTGALVADVVPGSPAEKAGIKTEDVITAVDGTNVADSKSLIDHVSKVKEGDVLALKIFRDGETTEKKVTVEIMGPRVRLRQRAGRPEGFPEIIIPGHDVGEMQKRIEQLERQVQELTRQLNELKAPPKSDDEQKPDQDK